MTDVYASLLIDRLPDGGFVVTEGHMPGSVNFSRQLFASSSIGEALAFIAGRLDPEAFKAWQEQQAKAAAHDAKAAEVSREFAKASEASPGRRCTCGFSGPSEAGRLPCGTCGRRVGIFENN